MTKHNQMSVHTLRASAGKFESYDAPVHFRSGPLYAKLHSYLVSRSKAIINSCSIMYTKEC